MKLKANDIYFILTGAKLAKSRFLSERTWELPHPNPSQALRSSVIAHLQLQLSSLGVM